MTCSIPFNPGPKPCASIPPRRSRAQSGFAAQAMRRLGPYTLIIALRWSSCCCPRIAVQLLLSHRGAGVHQRARGARPQPADGLRRAGQPRPRGLLRHRRLRGRARPDLSRNPVVAGAARRHCHPGLLAFVVGRPILRLKGYYLAVATLGMGLLIAMVISNETAIPAARTACRCRGSWCSAGA